VREIDAGHSAHRAVVLACAVGGLAALMLAGCGSARLTSAAPVRPVPGSPVPASAIPRLRAIADWYVRGDSQTVPQWVSALAHATPGFVPGPADELTMRTLPTFFGVLELLLTAGVLSPTIAPRTATRATATMLSLPAPA
jgi:hypothetical protein